MLSQTIDIFIPGIAGRIKANNSRLCRPRLCGPGNTAQDTTHHQHSAMTTLRNKSLPMLTQPLSAQKHLLPNEQTGVPRTIDQRWCVTLFAPTVSSVQPISERSCRQCVPACDVHFTGKSTFAQNWPPNPSSKDTGDLGYCLKNRCWT